MFALPSGAILAPEAIVARTGSVIAACVAVFASFACGSGPPAEKPPAPQAPVPQGPVEIPAELLGDWYSPDSVDGRWVVERPCDSGHVSFSVADGKPVTTLHMLVAEDEVSEILGITAVADGFDVLHTIAIAPDEPPTTLAVRFLTPDHQRIRYGDSVYLREAALDSLEVLLTPEPSEHCGPRIDSFEAAAPLGEGGTLVGYRVQGGRWVQSKESVGTDLSFYKTPPYLAYTDASGVDHRYLLDGALALDDGSFVIGAHPDDVDFKTKPVGVGYYRPDSVPPPLDPPLEGPDGKPGLAEAPQPKLAPPEGSWFVRLPGVPDWRAVAFAPEGASSPSTPSWGHGKAKGKGKAKAKQPN